MFRRGVLATALIVALVACGNGAPAGAHQITAATGGTVSSSDGSLTVQIPPHALAADTAIQVQMVSQTQWTDAMRAAQPVGPVYRLLPDGTQFSQPVRLTRVLSGADAAAFMSGSTRRFPVLLSPGDPSRAGILAGESVEFRNATITVSATTTHFSDYFVGKDFMYLGGRKTFLGQYGAALLPARVTQEVNDPPWEVTATITNDDKEFRGKVSDISFGASPVVQKVSNDTYSSFFIGNEAKTIQPEPKFSCSAAGDGYYFFNFTLVFDIYIAKELISSAPMQFSFAGDATCKPLIIGSTQPQTGGSLYPGQSPDPNARPILQPIEAKFVQAEFSTYYSEQAKDPNGGVIEYAWTLSPPPGDPTCNNFKAIVPPTISPNRAIWHHNSDKDGCSHSSRLTGPNGHPGTITVTVTSAYWKCSTEYFGSETGTQNKSVTCHRRT